MLKSLEISGFKSFAKKTVLEFSDPIVSIVGPNGSGKSNVVEAVRFALGEQSMKALRGRSSPDLIFKGSKNLSAPSRAAVTAVFDNHRRIFSFTNKDNAAVGVDFNEIRVTREVYPDGQNRYLINDTPVRLKDVVEVLSSVHVGSSGHHIISQGEADRVLSVSARERREMVEDALGLKIYQYKIREAERKLERTGQNVKEVQSLRREIAPHLSFLKKQVDKLKQTEVWRTELQSLYRDYFVRESFYLKTTTADLAKRKHAFIVELRELSEKTKENTTGPDKQVTELEKEIKQSENSFQSVRALKEELGRKLGRLEGALEVMVKTPHTAGAKVVNFEEIEELAAEIEINLDEALAIEELSEIAPILERVKELVRKFLDKRNSISDSTPIQNTELSKLKESRQEIADELRRVEVKEKEILSNTASLRQELAERREAAHGREKAFYEISARKSQTENALKMLSVEEEGLITAQLAFENELKEATVLAGKEATIFDLEDSKSDIDRTLQVVKLKKIEKIKIRLEDAGLGAGEEVFKEYNEVENRDQFLAKELVDLQGSIQSLKTLIRELKETLHLEFTGGVEKINEAFQEFFTTMFGGGKASLTIIKETRRSILSGGQGDEEELSEEEKKEGDPEVGIEINISLPHKKAKDLNMLSGGERALTSIALLFAMTRVNPPPFLILDETDAALDESNSRKYGDLIEKLSKLSQLILVTHNRETMSHAHVLYGVTIGTDGASKILSVRLDEALTVAN